MSQNAAEDRVHERQNRSGCRFAVQRVLVPLDRHHAAVLDRERELPALERQRGGGNGAATVELLKVLLRMTSERHAVAAKVIATIDELELIANDDHADVPALHGWRRELFGEKALALKHGKLSLAVEDGRVVALERP